MMLNIDSGITCPIYISRLWHYPWHDAQYYVNARRSCKTIVTIVVSASPSLMLVIPAMMYLMPMMIRCTIHSWCPNREGTVLHSSTQNHWAWLYTCMRIVTLVFFYCYSTCILRIFLPVNIAIVKVYMHHYIIVLSDHGSGITIDYGSMLA